MYATGTKKMLIVLIYDILKEYSDENHKLTQQAIIRLLKSNYDMDCDRRSVKQNIEWLNEMGKGISTEGGYYLTDRDFDDVDLRMLIDSVLFSKHLTKTQAKSLIDKLKNQGNRYFPVKVSHIINLPDLQHGDNKQLMYAVDTVNDAISGRKKIGFIYNDYRTDFKLHPRRDKEYIVNPYQMVANNGHYYLIGNYDTHDNVSHYRLDRMTCVRILDEKRKPRKTIKEFENGYNLPRHMAEHIYMFSGKSVRVKFTISKGMVNELVDWFGKDFNILKSDEEMMEVSVICNEDAMFFWALQYGEYVEVLEPKSLRDRVKRTVTDMAKRYKK